MEGSKCCSRCGRDKALSEFNRHPQTQDGRQSQCRACEKERRRDPSSRRGEAARRRQRYREDPEYRDRIKARALARARSADAEAKDRARESSRRWMKGRRTDPAFKALEEARRRQNRERLRALKDRPCDRCGAEAEARNMHFHHVDPAMKAAAVSDLVDCSSDVLKAEIAKCELLCAPCHRREHSKKPKA